MKMLNRKSIIFISVGVVCIILLLISAEAKKTPKASVDYEDELEMKLTELISGIDGVSDVKVMVVLECGTEYIYATNRESSQDREQIEYYSAGDDEALLVKEISPVIKGVAVVCDSTAKSSAKAKITRLIAGVLDISSTHIFVDT